ncbi:hypothetical protein LOZ80_39080 [Paenibacillus sp. HWE-109]|uniref:hypothetical protein n=1 Tax=Paenibacillus sp. HWE-109 TaxID=1306526 RepID=UPI001EE05C30|nr:hypothetical protein [Paenibacillus sp. HWE-109]UKS27371.1 hypothetical protein LOZ80_39080 [Paenibacillus sp. HWE-109]
MIYYLATNPRKVSFLYRGASPPSITIVLNDPSLGLRPPTQSLPRISALPQVDSLAGNAGLLTACRPAGAVRIGWKQAVLHRGNPQRQAIYAHKIQHEAFRLPPAAKTLVRAAAKDRRLFTNALPIALRSFPLLGLDTLMLLLACSSPWPLFTAAQASSVDSPAS